MISYDQLPKLAFFWSPKISNMSHQTSGKGLQAALQFLELPMSSLGGLTARLGRGLARKLKGTLVSYVFFFHIM